MEMVEEIRGKKFKEKVLAEHQSAQDFRSRVDEDLESSFPKATRADMQAALARLGRGSERVHARDGGAACAAVHRTHAAAGDDGSRQARRAPTSSLE